MINYKELMKGIDNKKLIKFPFSNEHVYLRLLTESDECEASKATDLEYSGREVNFYNSVERSSYKVSYELYLALVDSDNKRIYPSVNEFIKYTNKEVIRKLYEEYNNFEKEIFPQVQDLTDEQMKEIISEVKKNSKIIMTFTDINILKKLILFMVYLEETRQSGN